MHCVGNVLSVAGPRMTASDMFCTGACRQATGSGTELLPRLLPLWLNLIRAAKKGSFQEAASTLEQASIAVHFLQQQLLGADKGDEATDRLYTKSCQGVVRSLLEANSIPVRTTLLLLNCIACHWTGCMRM